MSEAVKVRLVRCPNCKKLLPEVTEYSVYECGNCGAVLRGVDSDTFSVNAEDERIGASAENLSERFDKSTNVSDRRTPPQVDPPTAITNGYESDVQSNVSSSSRRTYRERSETKRASLTNKEENGGVDANYVIQDKPKTAQGLVDGLHNLEYSGEQDREELLKKLDELRDQLTKGKEKGPADNRRGPPPPQDPYDAHYPDKQFRRPTGQHQYAEPPPPPPPYNMHPQEIGGGGNGFYPPQYAPNHMHGYADPSRAHMHRQDPYQISSSRSYMSSGHYMEDEVIEPYPRTFSHHQNHPRHHPSCSCYDCHNERRGYPIPNPILPTSYSSKYSNASNDRAAFPYHDYPGSFGSRDNNNHHHKFSNPASIRSHIAPQSHSRWPSDVGSEVGGFARRPPPRVRLATSAAKHCRPISGGAPFLSCYNCFMVLLLPKKVLAQSNKRKQTRCGACSTIIVFSVSDKNLVVLFDEEPQENPVEVDKKRVSLSKHEDVHYVNQVRARHSTSEADKDSRSFNSASANKPSNEVKRAPPSSGSSLQEQFINSDIFYAAAKSGGGEENKSGRSEQHEKVVLPNKPNININNNNINNNKNNNIKQMVREVSSATEIDLPSNEYKYDNTGTTFDSAEPSRGSRLAAEIFDGYKGSRRSEESFGEEVCNVTVNGHLIQDRLIKKAEKLAGTIQPGNYWYDFRAGFWGEIGGPCLGIIPPFIEEFNYPMPEKCAGGNTSVYINGRELNQKDLSLLGNRGLPKEPNKAYIVEISGRIIDEDTHEELDSLGKLAPTVERLKHGFGMRATKAA
ncbi:hypothetical protein ABFX02_02G173800 [Erythranthe guttata]